MTVLVLAIAALAIVAAWIVGSLARLAGARAAVSAAADAAALAAADDLARGAVSSACGDAARLAEANGAALVECRIAPSLVSVRVVVVRTVTAPWPVTVYAGARAAVDDAGNATERQGRGSGSAGEPAG